MEDEGAKALELDVRRELHDLIEASPGLHFREVQRRTGLAVGSLQYHLEYLEKKHMIRAERQGKFVRYFTVRGQQLGEQQTTMALLRQRSPRKIILTVLQKGPINNFALAQEAGLSPSTTSFHTTKLVDAGVLQKKRSGKETHYFIEDKDGVARLLKQYRSTFVDELVDNFVEIWDELQV